MGDYFEITGDVEGKLRFPAPTPLRRIWGRLNNLAIEKTISLGERKYQIINVVNKALFIALEPHIILVLFITAMFCSL